MLVEQADCRRIDVLMLRTPASTAASARARPCQTLLRSSWDLEQEGLTTTSWWIGVSDWDRDWNTNLQQRIAAVESSLVTVTG